MSKVKVGIIGTGVGIRTHYAAFKKTRNVEVYAIAGSSYERSKEYAQMYGIPHACSSYRELCEMDEIDLVCIAAPNRFHYEMMKCAINSHKHIICEKPVSENIFEIQELDCLVKHYDKIVVVDHQLRYNPYMTKIRELLVDQTIGTPYLVRINQEGVSFAKEDTKWSWSFDVEQGGGVRLAMASHFNDLIQYWFGNKVILDVSANLNPVFKNRIDNTGNRRSVEASTICNAKIELDSELSLMYTINAGAYRKFIFEIDIYGDKGQVHFDLDNKLQLYTRDAIGCAKKIFVDGVFEDEKENKASLFSGSFRYFAPEIIKAITTNPNAVERSAKIEDAIYNCNLLDAIKKSANTGKSVTFSVQENSYG